MNIKNFYSPSDSRPWAKQPFNFNGKTIATNGHVMLITNQDEKYSALPSDVGYLNSKIENILSDIESVMFNTPPKVVMPEKWECHYCKGSGKSLETTCNECDGECFVTLENEYSTYEGIECKTCFGNGFEIKLNTDNNCGLCFGSGKIYENNARVELDDVSFNPSYIDLILNEKNIKTSLLKDKKMLLFKTNEFKGCIMGFHDNK